MASNLILGRYTRRGLWRLFLTCAFPLHMWTLLLGFRDMAAVAAFSNTWNAIALVSYGLMFALAESAVVFLAAALLGFIVPAPWDPERRVTLLGSLALILALWGIANQVYFVLGASLPPPIVALLVLGQHPLRNIYAVTVLLVGASFLLPAWAALRNGRGLKLIDAVLDRLTLLTMLYLFLDVLALVIILIRNL